RQGFGARSGDRGSEQQTCRQTNDRAQFEPPCPASSCSAISISGGGRSLWRRLALSRRCGRMKAVQQRIATPRRALMVRAPRACLYDGAPKAPMIDGERIQDTTVDRRDAYEGDGDETPEECPVAVAEPHGPQRRGGARYARLGGRSDQDRLQHGGDRGSRRQR